MTKAIKVQRTVHMTEETSLLTEDAWTDQQALDYAENHDDLEWEETDLITHYKIVDVTG